MMDFVFEWDPEKERDNIREHGIDFKTAEHIINVVQVYPARPKCWQDQCFLIIQ